MIRGEIWTVAGGVHASKPRRALVVQDDRYDATWGGGAAMAGSGSSLLRDDGIAPEATASSTLRASL